MFELSKEQESELLRLQKIVTEKRIVFESLKKELNQFDSSGDVQLRSNAEEELRKASYRFNDFIGGLELRRS